MFKRYKMHLSSCNGGSYVVDFFVQMKKRRDGRFFYRATAIGDIPRLDSTRQDLGSFAENSGKLDRASMCSCEVWGENAPERWHGQNCLVKLWNRIASLKFVALSTGKCPFASDVEPKHENIVEADVIFGWRK